jgi:DNA-binding NarL/FixJ family response regulator
MSRQPTKVRILIIDDHALFRESVARLLAAEPDCQVVGHCASIDEALQVLAVTRVDLVLLDFDLGPQKGNRIHKARAKRRISRQSVDGNRRDQRMEAAELIRQGISGIFMKHSSAATLSQSIRQVMDGKVWFEQRYLTSAFESVPRRRSPPRASSHCTFLEGLGNKEIATRMEISESSVKASCSNCFAKTVFEPGASWFRLHSTGTGTFYSRGLRIQSRLCYSPLMS